MGTNLVIKTESKQHSRVLSLEIAVACPVSLGRETMTTLRERIVEPITTSSRTTIVWVPQPAQFHRYAWHPHSPSATTSASTHRSRTRPIPGDSSARWRSAHPQLAPSDYRLLGTQFDDRRRVNAWVNPHEAFSMLEPAPSTRIQLRPRILSIMTLGI
ncbi:hypothetical protein FEAC_00080 [Ferrimicrobium acidiphilum DSM 19497]|uniref:Uncharacterized protein n=2 Tax=Ferrimicrobium acidiphilum TaxID=121039 RepID=A0A0D8FYE1_9ACTN|nr:hypothetical protein FEAC_00080 [Ferrimicrobium acidiphilum DSM 19497]